MAKTVAELAAKLGLDTTEFETKLKSSTKLADELGAKLRNWVGRYATFEFIKENFREIIDASQRIYDLSTRLQMPIKDVQMWDYVAKKANSSGEILALFFDRIRKSREEALKGNQELITAFDILGISYDKLNNQQLKASDIGIQILKNIKGGQEQFGPYLQEVAGRGMQELFVLANENIDKLKNEFEELGLAIDENLIQRNKEFMSELKTIFTQIKTIVTTFASYVTYNPHLSLLEKTKLILKDNLDSLRALAEGKIGFLDFLTYNNMQGLMKFGLAKFPKDSRYYEIENKIKEYAESRIEKNKEEVKPTTNVEEARIKIQQLREYEAWKEFYEKSHSKYVEEERKISEQLKKIKFELLTPEQQRLELQKQLIRAQEEYNATMDENGKIYDKLRHQEAELNLLTIQRQIKELNLQIAKRREADFDRLTRVGGHVGAWEDTDVANMRNEIRRLNRLLTSGEAKFKIVD
jgi:hypothetical protein